VNYGVRERLKSIISLCGGQTCILASRLHIFIQMFVIFFCFGCVVINHQKGGDCKENGLRDIWLNRFWCLMINITCGLMCLLVFVFVVHRMLKLLGQRH
jgi:Na+-driven multidrug efflux pump